MSLTLFLYRWSLNFATQQKKRGFDWTDGPENGEENNCTQLRSKENLWDWKQLAKPNQLWRTLSGVGKVVRSCFFPSKLTQQVPSLETSAGLRGQGCVRRRETCTKRVVHGDKSVNQKAIDKQTNCSFQKTSLRLEEPQTTQMSSAFFKLKFFKAGNVLEITGYSCVVFGCKLEE